VDRPVTLSSKSISREVLSVILASTSFMVAVRFAIWVDRLSNVAGLVVFVVGGGAGGGGVLGEAQVQNQGSDTNML
jgi:hypothetical protein